MLNIERIKNFIQSANINFLFGSGLSRPYLNTLGDIERWLTELNTDDNLENSIITASIYKEYFDGVIYPNHPDEIDLRNLIDSDYSNVIKNYSAFLHYWNEIIARRGSNLLNKQINIFTTNIDLFVESAAETSRIEFNDGFRGVMNPIFDEGNFQKSYSKTSSHFQHTSEIPVFNLLKLHGSVNWIASATNSSDIKCDITLRLLKKIEEVLKSIDEKYFIEIESKDTIKTLKKKSQDIISKHKPLTASVYDDFNKYYNEIIMVNPTKRKFRETVLDLHFYELMRLYSNALEKENSILFTQGFSFADEHIAKITLRAAETNPTLLVIIFCYGNADKEKYEKNLKFENGGSKNNNIWIVTPEAFVNVNAKDDSHKKDLEKVYQKFDFATINEVYKWIGKLIPIKNYGK